MVMPLLLNSTQSAEETGDWAWAIDALDAESDDFEGTDRASVLIELTRFMALRGEPNDEVAAEVERLQVGYTDTQSIQELEAMRALRALVAGDLASAFESWLRAGKASAFQPGHFLNAGRAALWAGNADGAREALERFDAIGAHGAAYGTFRRTVAAGIAALQGRADEAVPAYREALREWRDLGATFDQALTALDMAQLLPGPAPDLPGIAAAARDIFAQLDARPFIDRLDAAMAAREGSVDAPSSAPSTSSSVATSGRA
jgi:tetratricopeptide (TPR) repeat protein